MVRKQDQSYNGNEESRLEVSYQESKNDINPKKNKKENSSSKKQKLIHKQKVTEKLGRKENEKLQRPLSNPQNVERMRDQIYDSQNQLQFSEFENYTPVINDQRQSQERSESQSNINTHRQILPVNNRNQEVLENLHMIFMQFFCSIDQPNGFVFKSQFRKKLRKIFPKIQFTDEHQLDPQRKEIEKIKLQIPRYMLIFDRKNHDVKFNNQEFQQYIQEDVKKMITVFKEASYIFCQEVTPQLYNILRKLCNIVVMNKNEDNHILIQHLRQFGDKIASYQDKQHRYIFFGYQMIFFQRNLTDKEIDVEAKKEKNKFALKNKYRQPGAEFADFTQKAGLHLGKIMRQLNCYNTLK